MSTEICHVEGCGIPADEDGWGCCDGHAYENGRIWLFCLVCDCWRRTPRGSGQRRCSLHGGVDYQPAPLHACNAILPIPIAPHRCTNSVSRQGERCPEHGGQDYQPAPVSHRCRWCSAERYHPSTLATHEEICLHRPGAWSTLAPSTTSPSVPGLGNAVTRSGLPEGEDPRPVEAALVGAGVPTEAPQGGRPPGHNTYCSSGGPAEGCRCQRWGLDEEEHEPCTGAPERLFDCCLAVVDGDECWNTRLPGEAFCSYHLSAGRELLEQENAEIQASVEALRPRIDALMAEAERQLVFERLTSSQRACLPPVGPARIPPRGAQ